MTIGEIGKIEDIFLDSNRSFNIVKKQGESYGYESSR